MTPTALSEQQKQGIEQVGYGLTGSIGGIQRKTYYTPDGRVVRLIPNIREYVKKDGAGKVIETGTRDANYDFGYLEQPPQVKKPFCPTCDKWHDTPAQVVECKRARERLIRKSESKERKQVKFEGDDRLSSLEKRLDMLTSVLERLAGGQVGKVLQSDGQGPSRKITGKSGSSPESVQ
jgi:hypothetical protein